MTEPLWTVEVEARPPEVIRVEVPGAPGPPGVAGPTGPTGPPGSAGAGFTHTQGGPSVTWTINHNLGYRPSVQVYNSGATLVWADVTHPTVNQTVITHKTALAGFARLN